MLLQHNIVKRYWSNKEMNSLQVTDQNMKGKHVVLMVPVSFLIPYTYRSKGTHKGRYGQAEFFIVTYQSKMCHRKLVYRCDFFTILLKSENRTSSIYLYTFRTRETRYGTYTIKSIRMDVFLGLQDYESHPVTLSLDFLSLPVSSSPSSSSEKESINRLRSKYPSVNFPSFGFSFR